MESPRETKRRRLDTPSKQSPATKQSPASRRKPTPRAALSGTPASRAKQARVGLSPYSQTKENAQPHNADQSETAAAAPQSALEKLRAKKQAQSNGDEDGQNIQVGKEPDTPSKAKSMAGFFKKFADPHLVSLRANEKDRESSEEATSGTDAADDPSDGGSPVTSVRASGRKKLLSTKLREQAEPKKSKSRTATSAKAKKTFEDEIKDLEAAARNEAGAEEADSATPAKSAGGRRAASRVQTPKEKAVEAANVTAPIEKSTPAAKKAPAEKKAPAQTNTPAEKGTPVAKKPRGRPRKNVQPEAIEIAVPEEPVPEVLVDGDAMEIDDSVEDLEEMPKERTPPWRPTRTPQKPTSAVMKKPTVDPSKLSPIETIQLGLLQRVALERINGKRPIPLTNLSDEYAKVNTVISQTITIGESNSMLLIGARGSGKTALVNQILREQADERPDDFHVVRLNGFVHTDDKIALREIWRQLGREMELDEEENTTRNYADTLASLLALLSHPVELGQEQAPGQTNKSVVFILDEFELFASHPRQTLLYNLFDIAQSRKAPIAVLGLTTRIDVAESLEKRVKSRFSHRYVHLSSSKSFPAFVEVCRAALIVHESSLTGDERTALLAEAGSPDSMALDTWNAAIDSFLSSDKVEPLLRRIYYTTKSVPEFLAALLLPLTTLPLSTSTYANIQDHIINTLNSRFSSPDSKLTILATLSTLQLALLICAARQTAIHATETVSFNLAYEEYKVLASKAKIQAAASGAMGAGGRVWSKETSKDAWMSLIDAGLVMEDGYSGRGGGAAGRVDVSLEEIGESGVDLGTWGRWCKEI
ncbi:hypothetical protein Q7P37_005946 [Cladosporium fusiforme]